MQPAEEDQDIKDSDLSNYFFIALLIMEPPVC